MESTGQVQAVADMLPAILAALSQRGLDAATAIGLTQMIANLHTILPNVREELLACMQRFLWSRCRTQGIAIAAGCCSSPGFLSPPQVQRVLESVIAAEESEEGPLLGQQALDLLGDCSPQLAEAFLREVHLKQLTPLNEQAKDSQNSQSCNDSQPFLWSLIRCTLLIESRLSLTTVKETLESLYNALRAQLSNAAKRKRGRPSKLSSRVQEFDFLMVALSAQAFTEYELSCTKGNETSRGYLTPLAHLFELEKTKGTSYDRQEVVWTRLPPALWLAALKAAMSAKPESLPGGSFLLTSILEYVAELATQDPADSATLADLLSSNLLSSLTRLTSETCQDLKDCKNLSCLCSAYQIILTCLLFSNQQSPADWEACLVSLTSEESQNPTALAYSTFRKQFNQTLSLVTNDKNADVSMFPILLLQLSILSILTQGKVKAREVAIFLARTSFNLPLKNPNPSSLSKLSNQEAIDFLATSALGKGSPESPQRFAQSCLGSALAKLPIGLGLQAMAEVLGVMERVTGGETEVKEWRNLDKETWNLFYQLLPAQSLHFLLRLSARKGGPVEEHPKAVVVFGFAVEVLLKGLATGFAATENATAMLQASLEALPLLASHLSTEGPLADVARCSDDVSKLCQVIKKWSALGSTGEARALVPAVVQTVETLRLELACRESSLQALPDESYTARLQRLGIGCQNSSIFHTTCTVKRSGSDSIRKDVEQLHCNGQGSREGDEQVPSLRHPDDEPSRKAKATEPRVNATNTLGKDSFRRQLISQQNQGSEGCAHEGDLVAPSSKRLSCHPRDSRPHHDPSISPEGVRISPQVIWEPGTNGEGQVQEGQHVRKLELEVMDEEENLEPSDAEPDYPNPEEEVARFCIKPSHGVGLFWNVGS